jgi:hypothetical protein
MINLSTLSPDVRHTVIDSVSDLAEGTWAALAVADEQDMRAFLTEQAEKFDLVHDKIVSNKELDLDEVKIVTDALDASEQNCVELDLDWAAVEYADARAAVNSL